MPRPLIPLACLLLAFANLSPATAQHASAHADTDIDTDIDSGANANAHDPAQVAIIATPGDDTDAMPMPARATGNTGGAATLYDQAYAAYEAGQWRQARRLTEQAIAADPESATYRVFQSFLFASRREFANAVDAADAAIARDAGDAQAWYLRGFARDGLGQSAPALADYRRALELDHRDSAFYRNYLKALNASRQYDTMLAVYDTFLERQREDPARLPTQADIPFYIAQVHHARADYPRAIELLNAAIDLSPDVSGYYANRALAYAAQRQYTQALADDATAIRLAPKEPSNYYNRGVTWLAQAQPARALEDFSRAQSLGQDDADVWLNLGAAHEQVGNKRQALRAYDRALRLAPGNAKARSNRASLLRELDRDGAADRDHALALAGASDDEVAVLRYNDAQARSRAGDWAAAVPLLQEAVRLRPDFERAWVNLAAAHVHLGQQQQALELFNDVQQRYPRSTITLLNRAQLYDQMGDATAARADYEQALRLDPRNADAMVLMAGHFKRAGDPHDAQAWFERARKSGPERPDLYINYSAMLLENGDHRQALVIAREGARAFPSDYKLQVNLANALSEAGEHADAAASYRRAIALRPRLLDAYYNLGNLYAVDMQDYAQGIAWYRRALEQAPDAEADAPTQREQRAAIRLNLATAQDLAGDRTGALASLQAAIEAEPDGYTAYFNRAGLRVSDGDVTGARRDFEAALTRMQRRADAAAPAGNEDPELLEYMGHAQFHLGQPDAALRNLQRSLQLRPQAPGTRRNLGYVLLDLDRPAEAKLQFEQAFTSEPDDIDGWLGLLACTALTDDARALARLKAQFAKRFARRYTLDEPLPTRLRNEGYWYSDRFRTLWTRVMADR